MRPSSSPLYAHSTHCRNYAKLTNELSVDQFRGSRVLHLHGPLRPRPSQILSVGLRLQDAPQMGLSRLATNLPHARRLQDLDLSASAATVAIQQVEESSTLAGAVHRRNASSVDGVDDRTMPTCGEGVEYRHGWDMPFEKYDWEHSDRSRM